VSLTYTFETQSTRPTYTRKRHEAHEEMSAAVVATATSGGSIVVKVAAGDDVKRLQNRLQNAVRLRLKRQKQDLRLRVVIEPRGVVLWCESKTGAATPTQAAVAADSVEGRIRLALQRSADGLTFDELAQAVYGRAPTSRTPSKMHELRTAIAALSKQRALEQDRQMRYSLVAR
jgi:hypothetical protein